MINFKGNHYPKEMILYAVFFYVRYAVSYRDLEEILYAPRTMQEVEILKPVIEASYNFANR